MALQSKAPTPASVERSIVAYLKKQGSPVRPSSLFSTKDVSEHSTAAERRRALWNLVDTGKIVVLHDRRVQLITAKK